MNTQVGLSWRHWVLLLLVLGSLAWMLSLEPIAQNPAYHGFADRRALLGIPNWLDVLSNLPFLFVGVIGCRFCVQAGLGTAGRAWVVLFAGVALTSAGSAYYHWSPNNDSLLWDRLPMTIGFMGLFAALAGEYMHERLGKLLLVPAVLLGFASVIYWHWVDDLRFYYWVQLASLLSVPVLMVLFKSRYSHQWVLLVAVAWYALAKVTEATIWPYSGAPERRSADTRSSISWLLPVATAFCGC